MITVAMLRQAGASADLIARVCEIEEQERIEKRRTQVREAVRRHRRKKVSNGSSNQCNDYSDYRDYTPSIRLSPSWTPKEETRKKILERVSEADFALGLDRFRNHYTATGASFVDPDAKLLNWFTNPLQTKGNGNGHTPEPRKFSREWQREEAARVLETLKNYPRGGDGADPSVVGWLSDRTDDGG